MVLVGAGVASAVYITRKDFAYMLVILWAFVGIAVEHKDTALVTNAAWVGTGIVAGVLLVGSIMYYTLKRPRGARGEERIE